MVKHFLWYKSLCGVELLLGDEFFDFIDGDGFIDIAARADLLAETGASRRVVFREDLLNYLDQAGLLLRDEDHTSKHDVIYARVSSNEQKQKGGLDRQVMFLLEHVNDLQNPLVLKEVGSGLNDQRRKVQQLIQMVLEGKVNRVYITQTSHMGSTV